MKLEDIQTSISEDSNLDSTELGKESLRIPNLISKYLNLRSKENILLKQLESNQAIDFKKRWEFYLGKAPPKDYKDEPFDHKVLRSDIEIYLKADKVLQEWDNKILMQRSKIDIIDQFVKELGQRGWNIKNSIEWIKLMNGGMV